jgi:hypothetical protein
LSFKARSTAGASLVERLKASTERSGVEGTHYQPSFCDSQNRLPHLRDGQPVDRAPEKKRRAENFDGAKLTRCRIFDGEFTANTIDLAAAMMR